MLTPQQIAEMDSITGRSTPTAKTSPGISRANEIRALGSKNVSFMEKQKDILTGPKRQARVQEIVQPYKEGTQKLLPTIFQLGGEVIKGAFESASELPIVKQGLNLLGEGINEMSQDKVTKYLGEKLTPATEKVLSWYESRTPEEKRNIDAASQYLSIMPVGKATETGVSSGIKATERVVDTASDVVKATGRGTSQVFGATTGAGASSVKEAFIAASEGKPALESFTRAMRGQTPASDIVKSVEDITQTVREQRAANYTSKLKEIGEDVSQHNIAPVLSELDSQLGKFGITKNADGTLDFSRSAIAKSREARNDIQGVYETIKDWGTKKGDRTGIGLDTLKRQLGDFYSDSSQAKAFVQGIKRKVTDILETEVKGYKEMTSEYQKASAFLDDIRSATGSGTSASPDTIFTKLTTGMKADKEFRLEIMKEMEKVDPQLMNKIAGINLSPWMPRGLVGRATDAGAALGALTGFFNPQLIPFLLATSPRVVGEFARAAGIATNKINEILNSIKTLSSLKVDVKGVLESIKEIHNQEGGFIKIPSFGSEESVPKSILEKSVQKTVPSPNSNIKGEKKIGQLYESDYNLLNKYVDAVRLKGKPEAPIMSEKEWLRTEDIMQRMDFDLEKSMSKLANDAEQVMVGRRGIGNLYKNEGLEVKKTHSKDVISQADSSLIQEAKKYKTAEEFVKAQGEPLYHGTTARGREGISKEGFKLQNSRDSFNQGTGISITTDTKIASKFTGKDGEVLDVVLDPKAKLFDGDEFKSLVRKEYNGNQLRGEILAEDKVVKKLKSEGYDGIDYRGRKASESYESEIRIWNTEKLKTKSQLTDIWNKANKK